MMERPTDQSRRVASLLVRQLADSIVKSYRIDRRGATEQIALLIERDDALQKALGEERGIDEIRRMRVFKELEKRARRQVYNHLRRYKRADKELAQAVDVLERLPPGQEDDIAANAEQAICAAHVSTAERLDSLRRFEAFLARHCAGARSILDLGCGVAPLLFPFAACPELEYYLALDRDRAALRAVTAFARWRELSLLEAREWSISDGWNGVAAPGGKSFDVALLLKLVPVVTRQEPALLDVLANTPARTLIISGSKEALAKRRIIVHREVALIRTFVEKFGASAYDSFETNDEVGVVVSK